MALRPTENGSRARLISRLATHDPPRDPNGTGFGPDHHSSFRRLVYWEDPTTAGYVTALVQVLDDLVRRRPLVGRDDEEDVAAAEAVEGVIRDAGRVQAGAPQVVTPGDRGLLILERGHGLPVGQARVADRDRRLPCGSGSE